MTLFFLGLLILLAGYCTYGRLVERILSPDDRPTPGLEKGDGVDYVILPHWKNMLIQLLNIAGIGPVIGVIIGIKFGTLVFLIIPIGNIIAGATHDFLCGMMSIRGGGANLPAIIKSNLGRGYASIFSVFMIFLLLLVVAVFINIPANLIDAFFPSVNLFWYAVVGIFIYYIIATLFSIDKIIGKIYPIFGGLLVFGTAAIFAMLVYCGIENHAILEQSQEFTSKMWTSENGHPIIPLLFVTIACGIISGFHGTQSPIVARTMKTERQCRSTFYGMMVLEGLIAMVWAAGALAIYNIYPETFSQKPTAVLSKITGNFLGAGMGTVTILGVIILAVTSGDTAMRSIRLSLAEILKIQQKKISSRIILALPIVLAVSVILAWSNSDTESFNKLWNYFAWGNQVLAASSLMAAVVWLRKNGKPAMVAMVPAMFMTFIVICYILWISPEHGGPVGFGLDLQQSYGVAALFTIIIAALVGDSSVKGLNTNWKK